MLHFTWCNRPLSTFQSSILFTSFFSLDTRHHSVSYRFLFGQLLEIQCLQSKVLTAFCFPSLIASVMSQSLIYLMTLIASAALEGKSLFDWRWNPQTCLLDVASWGPSIRKSNLTLWGHGPLISIMQCTFFYWFLRHFITFFM